jgi:hypothetical protein
MNAGTAISAQGAAIAVFRAISSARRRPPAAMPIAAPIPISASTRNCSPIAAANPQGGSDAHSGLGDFGDRDGLNRAGGGPDVRSGLSGFVRPGQLLRMPLHVAASVQRVGIGPRGTVRHQSIFRERGRARGLSAASPRLLKL